MIKAEVGDTILVTFVNKASWPFSIQPHGVSYGKAWEGMRYHDGLCLLFSSNSKLLLVVELCSPYRSVPGVLQPGRAGCPVAGSQPGPQSLPEASPKDTSPELVSREGGRGRAVPDENCKPKLRPLPAVWDPVSRGTCPVHSSLENLVLPVFVMEKQLDSLLPPVAMPISAMAWWSLHDPKSIFPCAYKHTHITLQTCRVFW